MTIAFIAAALVLGMGIGYLLRSLKKVPDCPVNHAKLESDAEQSGWDVGWDAGYADIKRLSLERAKTALDAFPTSLGGRAMYRAIGGDPGPLPRKPKPSSVTADVPDAGEGPEAL